MIGHQTDRRGWRAGFMLTPSASAAERNVSEFPGNTCAAGTISLVRRIRADTRRFAVRMRPGPCIPGIGL